MENPAQQKEINPEIEALLKEAEAHIHAEAYNEAIDALDKIIEINPKHDHALLLKGDILLKHNYLDHAAALYADLLERYPDKRLYREKFFRAIATLTFGTYSYRIKKLILLCLETPDIEAWFFGHSWLSFLRTDPHLGALYDALDKPDYESFETGLRSVWDFDCLADPYLLLGLKKFVVSNLDFERMLQHLRRFLLQQITGNQNLVPKDERNAFLASFAHYAYETDYIFSLTDDEEKQLSALQKGIESGELENDLGAVAIFAAYYPLGTLKNAARIEALFEGSVLHDVIVQQISDPSDRVEISKNIEALTDVSLGVSSDVRKQYEESPYPRWAYFSSTMGNASIEGPLDKAGVKVLNAGCGTGWEAMEAATYLPKSEVLGVDLSMTSLSFAAQQAHKRGIKNISFKQGDILKLDDPEILKPEYDYIISSGVLHHMEDPFAGWKVLTNLLEPGGIMRIALYSQTARWAVNEARQAIEAAGVDRGNLQHIKNFRRDSAQHISEEALDNLTDFNDYYTLSEYRDLVFHVQEHQYTLPLLQKTLDDLGLEFIRFMLPGTVMESFTEAYPDDPEGALLENWEEYESNNPDTFKSMYKFWCKKAV